MEKKATRGDRLSPKTHQSGLVALPFSADRPYDNVLAAASAHCSFATHHAAHQPN